MHGIVNLIKSDERLKEMPFLVVYDTIEILIEMGLIKKCEVWRIGVEDAQP